MNVPIMCLIVRMVERLALRTLGHVVVGSNPVAGGVLAEYERPLLAQSSS